MKKAYALFFWSLGNDSRFTYIGRLEEYEYNDYQSGLGTSHTHFILLTAVADRPIREGAEITDLCADELVWKLDDWGEFEIDQYIASEGDEFTNRQAKVIIGAL